MTINESIPESTHIHVNGNVEVEDVVVAGAGPAGLMLAYVEFREKRHHVVLTEPK